MVDVVIIGSDLIGLTSEGDLLYHNLYAEDNSTRTISFSDVGDIIEVDVFGEEYIKQGSTQRVHLMNPVVKLARPLDTRDKDGLAVLDDKGILITNINKTIIDYNLVQIADGYYGKMVSQTAAKIEKLYVFNHKYSGATIYMITEKGDLFTYPSDFISNISVLDNNVSDLLYVKEDPIAPITILAEYLKY